MKIFSKKSYRFDKEGQNSVTVGIGFSPELPEWIKDSMLFKLAVKENSINVIAKKDDQSSIEKGLEDAKLAELREQAKNLGIKNYEKMKQPTLETKIAEALKKIEEKQENNSGGTDTDSENDGNGENGGGTDE